MKLSIKTTGAAQGLVESIDFEAKVLADAINAEISGYPATELQSLALTQEFVNKHNITARYTSGTFLGFKIQDSAIDEFETFKK